VDRSTHRHHSGDTMNILGIDPGLDGALVVLDGRTLRVLAQTLTRELCADGYVPELMDARVSELCSEHAVTTAVIERVSARPGEGVVSSFRFGVGWGLWRGIIAGRCSRVLEPTPQRWQRIVLRDIPGEGKARSIARAAALPGLELVGGRRRKPHDGLADAACLALYATHTMEET
jgi:crossover junction endodeoxyribonuclease RuvC